MADSIFASPQQSRQLDREGEGLFLLRLEFYQGQVNDVLLEGGARVYVLRRFRMRLTWVGMQPSGDVASLARWQPGTGWR